MAFPTGWGKRQKITIDYTKVSTSNFTDFTVLLSDGNFLDDCYIFSQSAGQDLRFTTDSVGTTQIPFEVVSWDIANKKAEVYVKIPTLSYEANTIIYVWYSNPTASALAVNDTYGSDNAWDSSFKGVHHLNGAAVGNLLDSTANNVDMDTAQGTPTYNVDGKWGKGVNFGNNSSIRKDSYNFASSNITATVWLKLTTDSDTNGLFSIGRADAPVGGFAFYTDSPNVGTISINSQYGKSCTIPAAGSWFSLTGAYDGSNVRIYLNGAYNSQVAGAVPSANNAIDYIIGALKYNTSYADAIIEEVRFSNSYRGDAWITTEYNNLSSPSTFSSGSEIVNLLGGGSFLLNFV
jgi:hypothetical protein